MDPITAATAFASVISLLADFVATRKSTEGKSYEEFVAWLADQRHDEIKSLLETNTTTSVSIKALLAHNQREILSVLNSLDVALARFAASFEEFRSIAEAAHPDAVLSEQAISILEQMHDSQSRVLRIQFLEGVKFGYMDGASGNLALIEPRFADEDFSSLVEAGFLTREYNGRGDPFYILRRAASRFVEQKRKRVFS